MMRATFVRVVGCVLSVLLLFRFVDAEEKEPEKLSAAQQTAVDEITRRADDLKAVNQSIWNYAEVGLQENQSSQLLIEKLKQDGFTVKSGVADMEAGNP